MVEEKKLVEASRAHLSVDPSLRETPLVLSCTRDRVLHNPIDIGKIAPPKWWRTSGVPGETLPDHWTVRRWLSVGRGELADSESWFNDPYHALALGRAMKEHRDHGYVIPDHFIDDRSPSYGENEAWFAAQHLVRRASHLSARHRMIHGGAMLPQVAVPRRSNIDPFAPYLLDQLWIVPVGERYRLVALEVDGEGHLTAERVRHGRERDARLVDAGYEVVHVAGWWCRIDPWRVIAEAIYAMNITTRIRMPGDTLTSIDEYVCDYCNHRVTRSDDHDLETFDHRNVMHRECAEERAEDGDYTGSESDERDEDQEPKPVHECDGSRSRTMRQIVEAAQARWAAQQAHFEMLNRDNRFNDAND